MIIYFKTSRLYRLTGHEGIKYFFMGFLFYALGFLAIYVTDWKVLLGENLIWNYLPIVMEYFLIMGGFYITYSLLWKKFLDNLFISRIALLHIVAIMVAIIDFFFTRTYLMYIVELTIGIYAAFIIYHNYIDNKEHKFTQFYLISMICNILGWLMYFITWITQNSYPIIGLYTYIITLAAFILLLYGVLRVEQKNGKKA